MASSDRLRIALVAPPMLPVPPPSYAGTERVVAALAESPARHLDIFRHAPQSRGARDYQELVDELVSAGFIA